MLTMNDGRSELWQWDTGRTLAVDADCSQVHFSNKVFGRSIDVDVVDGAAIIPDVLLQTDKDLNVWAFVGTAENGYTKISKTFKVNRRNKPADYVFTPAEQMTLNIIQRQIGDLSDLTTEANDTLVAAINEAARTGGGAGSMELRVAEGYVQYSRDGGMTWTNLIAMADLKGDPGTAGKDGHSPVVTATKSGKTTTISVDGAAIATVEDGADGKPGPAGTDGITPTIGANGNWYLGDTDTGKPSRGEAGKAGADGADGAPGADGKSAYQYAKEGGYTGTEAEFAAKLAQEKFANPNAMTFTGAVTGSYDGSEPLTVEIPSGGGGSSGSSWKLIRTVDIVSGTSSYSFDKDNDWNSFKLKNFLVLIDTYPSTGYLEIKPNDNFSFVQKPNAKQNSPFSFMMKRATDGRYILENSNTNGSIFERKISNEYSSFGEFTSFSFWFSVAPTSDTTMYILGGDA